MTGLDGMLKNNKMSKGSLPKISPLVQIVYALMTPILLKLVCIVTFTIQVYVA